MFNDNDYWTQCIPTENLREDDGNTFFWCNVFFFYSYKIFKGSFMSHLYPLPTDYPQCSSPALLVYRSAATPITHKSLTNLSPFICVCGSPLKAMLQDWLLPISTISFWQATVSVTRHQLYTDVTWQGCSLVCNHKQGSCLQDRRGGDTGGAALKMHICGPVS